MLVVHPTLANPLTIAHQAHLSVESGKECWSGLPFPVQGIFLPVGWDLSGHMSELTGKLFKSCLVALKHLVVHMVFGAALVGSQCAKPASFVSDSCNSMDLSLPGFSVLGISSGKNTGMCFFAHLQGIFPIQGLNMVFYVPCINKVFATSATESLRILLEYSRRHSGGDLLTKLYCYHNTHCVSCAFKSRAVHLGFIWCQSIVWSIFIQVCPQQSPMLRWGSSSTARKDYRAEPLLTWAASWTGGMVCDAWTGCVGAQLLINFLSLQWPIG